MTPRENISNGNVSGNEQQKEKSYENHEPKKFLQYLASTRV